MALIDETFLPHSSHYCSSHQISRSMSGLSVLLEEAWVCYLSNYPFSTWCIRQLLQCNLIQLGVV